MANTPPKTVLVARKKKLPSYKSFRLNRKITIDRTKPLPSVWSLTKDTWKFLWRFRAKMLLFAFLYALTYILFVKGVSGFSLETAEIKEELSAIGDGNVGRVITMVAIYWSLLSSLNTTDDLANFYLAGIIIIFSLAFIWLLRKLHSREITATVKDSFYKGMTPLVPFMGVVLIMLLQIMPAGIGAILLSTAQSTSVFTTSGEFLAISVLAILTFTMSVYLLSGSLFALYIVTLPGTYPVVAIRSSMRLLRIHRWKVVYRIAAFSAGLLVLGFVLALPFIIWLPRYAEIGFFVISCGSFAVVHTYMYKLYRSMI